MPDPREDQPPLDGQIVTFYSFKGGTGRTMALANVAWILAANGMRVLMADWDLESPGLHRFFQPFMDPGAVNGPGIIDVIRWYQITAVDSEIDRDALHGNKESKLATRPAIAGVVDENIERVNDYAIPLNWNFPAGGALYFLSPGRLTNGDFQATVGSLDWETFYDNLAGPEFLDALRANLKRSYDYVLIDSRTGHGDIADICTVHLPDVVVDCFTLATQSIEGAAMIAKRIKAEIQENPEREIKILPAPMRIDQTEQQKVGAGLDFAAQEFEGLFAGMSEGQRREYLTEMQIPYRSSYAYEEMLAAFQDMPGSQSGLLPHYERITARITGGAVSKLPPRDEWVRLRTRLKFSRTQPSSLTSVLVDFRPEDQLWAEWIAAVLASAEIQAQLTGEVSAGPDDSRTAARTVAVVSDAYISQIYDSPPAKFPSLLISVTNTRLPAHLAEVPVVFLTELSESDAAETLIEKLGGHQPADPESGTGALRYPGGDHPEVVNLPARNVNFTGRDKDLKELREQLRTSGTTALLPLAIHGLGGVGKTQLALEYAHRFKTDYDVIWWMPCGQSQYVDASLLDLGQALQAKFDVTLPEEGEGIEEAQRVLQLLSAGLPDKRWLLVYDNAEDVEYLKELLPGGPGHVLITSRKDAWKSVGKYLKIDVFKREESISHLRRRAPKIAAADANEVAGVLGDMPLAVSAAGALLASTDIVVSDYLRELIQKPTRTFSADDPLRDYPAESAKAWELSLDELQKRSPAAARLLELCCFMAPEISDELITTQTMVNVLHDIDPAIAERAMIAQLTLQIEKLALIKLDTNEKQIQVHRVVQAVVKERMSDDAKARARRDVHRLMVAARPEGDVDDQETWPRYRLIWPHLTPSAAMWSTDLTVRQLLIERVRYLGQRDDLERGRRRAEEIKRAWEIMLAGVADPKVPESQQMVTRTPDPELAEAVQRQLFRLEFNLANIMRDLARFEEARKVDEAVLAGQLKHIGKKHPHTLHTRSSLAADLRALGDYKGALALDMETYEVWTNGWGDDYRGTLSAAHNLALSYLLTGDFQRALTLDRLTLERRATVHGPSHPRTLNSGSSVARDLLEAGRYTDAVARMENVLRVCRAELGDLDRITLNARLLLGVACRCAGNLDRAVEQIDAARTGLTRGFGGDSSDALACRLSQALNWLAMHRRGEARMAAEEVLAIYEQRLGATHPHSLVCNLDISTALCIEKEYQAAEIKVRPAVAGLTAQLGEAHPYTLAAKMVLASARAGQNDFDETRELEETVISERNRVLGPQHPDTLRCRANLMLTRQAQGADGATGERQAIIANLAARIGNQHPDVNAALGGNRLLGVVDPLPF